MSAAYECHYCAKPLPEADMDALILADGRTGEHVYVCMACRRFYKLKIVNIIKPRRDSA